MENNVFITEKGSDFRYFSIRNASTKQNIYNRANSQLKLRLQPYLGKDLINRTEWHIFDCGFMSIYDSKNGGRFAKIMNLPKYVIEIAKQQTTETKEIKED